MPNNGSQHATDATLQTLLDARYGVTMSTQEVAETLKMSVGALRMARSRNQFPLQPILMDGRRHHIYSTKEVAAFLLARLPAALVCTPERRWLVDRLNPPADVIGNSGPTSAMQRKSGHRRRSSRSGSRADSGVDGRMSIEN